MPPETAKYLRDMLDAAGAIGERSAGMSDAEFVANLLARDAVTWNFCVIGEALSKLLRVHEPVGRQMTDSRKIVGLRNQLIHGYGVIDHAITWQIVTDKLPILRREPERLLAE